MTTPPPSQITSASGERLYYNPYSGRYTRSRSYGLRMQRGYAAGRLQTSARGKRTSEQQQRISLGLPLAPGVPRPRGYEEQAPRLGGGFIWPYRFPQAFWNRMYNQYVREINRRSSPGSQFEPYMIDQVVQVWNMGWRDQNRPELDSWEVWVEVHIAERLESMIQFQDFNDRSFGYLNFQLRSNVPPIEFWWYH